MLNMITRPRRNKDQTNDENDNDNVYDDDSDATMQKN